MSRINGFCLILFSAAALAFFSTANARLAMNSAKNGNEISLAEAYVFADNKTDFLSTLVPGSEEYYFYHTLFFQNQSLKDKAQLKNSARMIYEWENNKSHPSVKSQRLQELKNRQALLEYDKNPAKTLEYLKKQLGIGFNHYKKGGEKQRAYPSSLDNSKISTDKITQKLLSRKNSGLSDFTQEGLYQLDANSLKMPQLRELLHRIDTPDYPDLVQLIVRELKDKKSSGFGAYVIHEKLTLPQMDKIRSAVKGLDSNDDFVISYMRRLLPINVRAEKDPVTRLKNLMKVWSFVKTLPQVQNSIKLHLLNDMLITGQKVDKYDKKLFVEYLKIPRVSIFTKQKLLRKRGRNIATLNSFVAIQSGLIAIDNDRELVDDYLNHFLVDAKNYNEFLPFLEEKFLKHAFAEIKILNGVGDKKKWFAQLPANKYEEINERVELRILPKNKLNYKSKDKVELLLDLKNIDSLVANIYQVNPGNYYRKHSERVDISINLEGLQANHQSVIKFDNPSHIRHAYTLSVPQANKAGVYVVDLVGNGINSRAVIIKGGLNFTQREGVSGHLFRIYDEDNKLVKDGSIWVKGHNYTSDKKGRIIVPFTKQPGMQDIVISSNVSGMASLHTFFHSEEKYELKAGILFNQEALISSNPTEIAISPQLLLNGRPVDNSILKDITVELTISKPGSGGESVVEKKIFTDLKLEAGNDIKIPFTLIKGVGAAILRLELNADIEIVSRNKTEKLSHSFAQSLSYDAIATKIGDAYLRKAGDDYLIDVIGRNGESLANHSLQTEFINRNFKQKIRVSLQSDSNGTIRLGELEDIKQLKVSDATGINRTWNLYREIANMPAAIVVKSGENIVLPFDNKLPATLFELADHNYLYDRSEKISQEDNHVEIKPLKDGRYKYSNGKYKLTITVKDGEVANGFILSKDDYLQYKQYKPQLVTEIVENGVFSKSLVLRVKNADENTRVHLIGSRFINDDLAQSFMLNPNLAKGQGYKGEEQARYSSGRRLSDELRYIMERKLADKYPGNMLKRPSLLMKPLEFGKTSTQEKAFAGGGEWDEEQMEARKMKSPPLSRMRSKYEQGTTTPDYNFLAGKSLVLLNQIPNKDGEVKIELTKLAGNQRIAVVVTNGSNIAYAHYDRSESKPIYKDIRQKKQFSTNDHYRQENSIKIYDDLSRFNKKDIAVSDYETYSSAAEVFALYKAINGDAKLDEFRFLLSWDQLEDVEKKHKYSRYASHELNFYLYHRDKKFFDTNIKPVISNKLKKDFIDDWLLHYDLKKYTSEYQYSRLNVIEKALLAKRVKWQKEAVLVDLTDSINSREVDYSKLDRLFEIALTGGVDSSAYADKDMAFESEIRMERAKSKPKSRRMMKPMAASPAMGMQSLAKQQYLGEVADMAFEKNQRGKIDQFYTAPDKTKSWIEQRYFGVLPDKLDANYIHLTGFWVDYIKSKKEKVLSTQIAMPTNNLTEMIFALAVLDLPVKPFLPPNAKNKDKAAKGVVFAKLQYKEETAKQNNSILLGQNIFPKEQRYKYVDNKKQENFIEDGFVKGQIYGVQTVVTNTTSLQEIQELFIQIPQGAIPVGNGFYNKSMKVNLDPFATQTIENYFYFPSSGDFSLYPAHSFDKSGMMSFAKARQFTVHDKPVIADKDSWDYISQNGTEDQQIEFLKKHNIKRIDLSKIAYRYKDKNFYIRLLKVLKDKHHFDSTFWSYSIKHNISEEISNYLHVNGFAKRCGDFLDTSLIKIHVEDDGSYLHKEFWPLINKRVFQFGNKRYIENKQLLEQYNSLMQLISYKGIPNSYDALVISYYLLLQDRVADAEKWFAKVDKSKVFQKMGYDYLAAYLAFYKADVKQAYSIAERYSDYPLEHWRDMFVDILNQAKQVNQTEVKQAYSADSLKDRERLMLSFAADDPAIDIKTKGDKIQLRLRNLNKCKLNFYAMDLEVLFSRKPFAMQLSDQFGMIQPNVSIDVEAGKDQLGAIKDKGATEVAIPEQLKGKSLLVEVKAGAVSESVNYYPNTLVTHINEKYGIARITSAENSKPLSSVYIKVYARFKNGKVKFYKDGYTDLRGMFDYLSQNDDNLEQIERLSILILSDENGALIKEVAPPKM